MASSRTQIQADPPKRGRPTIFSEQLAKEICSRITNGDGRSLRSVCEDDDMPNISTILAWLADKDKDDFSKQYARACESRAQVFFDEILEIAKDNEIPVDRARLMIDSRKWILARMNPKKYADKGIVIEANSEGTGPAQVIFRDVRQEKHG